MFYKPRPSTILALSLFYTIPEPAMQSNFMAMANKCRDMQNNTYNLNPSYSSDAPQERDVEIRLARRKVKQTLDKLSTLHQAALQASYSDQDRPEDLDRALGPPLAGMAALSKLNPAKNLSNGAIVAAARYELDRLWSDAHYEFERAYVS